MIVVAVKEAIPNAKVKKGDVSRAVIVRTAKEISRDDGSYIRFDGNSAVLLDKDHEPIGTRIFGPVARELRAKKFSEDYLARAGGAVMAVRAKYKIKKNDTVMVVTGRDRGKTGKVMRVLPEAGASWSSGSISSSAIPSRVARRARAESSRRKRRSISRTS